MLPKISQQLKILNNIHFAILILVILNLIILYFLNYELIYEIEYSLNIGLYLSGVILFLVNNKVFNLKTVYFSVFPITIISFGIFYLFGGILFALIGGTLIKPLYPTFSEYNKNGIVLYPKYNGFMSRCCPYKVNENHGIFEKKLGNVFLNMDSAPPNSEIGIINKNILKVTYKDYQNQQQTELIKLEN